MRTWIAVGALGSLLVVNGHAMAQEDCESTGIDFDQGSTNLDLDAQGDLSEVANWALLETGRYLLVSANAGPTPAEARLANVRASAVVHYLQVLGVSPTVIAVVPPEGVSPSRRHALGLRAAVVVSTCFGSGPASEP